MGVVVETAYGKLEGVREDGLQIFRGIPFARPPLGPLRFRAPEPPEAWAGVRAAREFGRSAPQIVGVFDAIPGFDVGESSEDCLYLNVVTPAADAERRPVMVWIHGGAFVIGSASQSLYDLRSLARRGECVLVSVNYRLGALGFLHLADLCGADLGATTNAGILDQLAALEWVRDNIEAFGGDPDSVTLFGESAGAMSIGTLLGSPEARGLFHRAIAQSGAAQAVSSAAEATEVAEEFLSKLEIDPADAERLRDLSIDAILAAQNHCMREIDKKRAQLAFRPVVDGSCLPEHPLDAIRSGLSRDVPLIVGSCRDEWRLFGLMDPGAAKLDEAALMKRLERRIPGSDARGASHRRKIVDAYREARGGGGSTAASDLFFAIEGDRIFGIPAIRLAEAQGAHQRKTFAYLVTWESPIMGGALGACHGIDLPFVFGSIGSKQADMFAGGGSEAVALSERMMDAWLAFARDADPNHPGLPAWPAYGEKHRATMLLGRICEVADDPKGAERRAWEGVL